MRYWIAILASLLFAASTNAATLTSQDRLVRVTYELLDFFGAPVNYVDEVMAPDTAPFSASVGVPPSFPTSTGSHASTIVGSQIDFSGTLDAYAMVSSTFETETTTGTSHVIVDFTLASSEPYSVESTFDFTGSCASGSGRVRLTGPSGLIRDDSYSSTAQPLVECNPLCSNTEHAVVGDPLVPGNYTLELIASTFANDGIGPEDPCPDATINVEYEFLVHLGVPTVPLSSPGALGAIAAALLASGAHAIRARRCDRRR